MKNRTGTRACQLARRQLPSLRKRYALVLADLRANGHSRGVRGFEAILDARGASINMSIGNCIQFLESGRWLNIYETAAMETRLSGEDLLRAVEQKMPRWFRQRRIFEDLLRFRRDSHYAAVNLGGPGATRYGKCCVNIDIGTQRGKTCFAGDSLRTVFNASGMKILEDEGVLARFAPEDEVTPLAVVRHHALIEGFPLAVSGMRVRATLENSDSLIEIHVHGPIKRQDIQSVVMEQGVLSHLWELTLRFEDASMAERAAMEFDIVPYFKQLLLMLDRYEVPLFEA